MWPLKRCCPARTCNHTGIGLYRPGQAVPPGKVVAWGRYVLPEQDVRLAKPWWLPGMVNPQGHAP
mgnify:CR=1 FL=1